MCGGRRPLPEALELADLIGTTRLAWLTSIAPRGANRYGMGMYKIRVGEGVVEASSAEEAVKKAKVIQAVGRSAVIIDPDGVEIDVQTLELALSGKRFGDDA